MPESLPNLETLSGEPLWYKAAHVAPILGMTTAVLLSAIDCGQLPFRSTQLGGNGTWHVLRADVLAYIRSYLPVEGSQA